MSGPASPREARDSTCAGPKVPGRRGTYGVRGANPNAARKRFSVNASSSNSPTPSAWRSLAASSGALPFHAGPRVYELVREPDRGRAVHPRLRAVAEDLEARVVVDPHVGAGAGRARRL